MNKYNPNPISFKSKNEIVYTKQLNYDFHINPFKLELINSDTNEILFEKSIMTDTVFPVINIDCSGNFTLNYYDIMNDELIYTDAIYVEIVDVFFDNVKRYVCQNIDNIVNENDKKFHLSMIKKCNHNLKAREYIENRIKILIKSQFELDDNQINSYKYKIFSDVYGLGILQELDDDESINEIMVNVLDKNGMNTKIYYVKNQEKYDYNKKFNNIEEVLTVFNRVLSGTDKELNTQKKSSIEVSRTNNDRITITIPNYSINYSLNIRRFKGFIPNEENMRSSGTLNDELIDLLDIIVDSELNIGIGGKMGEGKTTLINYLLTLIKDVKERVCVISSVDETDTLRTLKNNDIIIYNVDETHGFTFSDAFIKALRSKSDRIVVPESRDKEFKQIYKANIQISGNMFTAHARSNETFMNACVDMYNYDNTYSNLDGLKNMIAKGMDIIIIMKKIGNKIIIKSISEVLIIDGIFKGYNVLYEWTFDKNNPENGYYRKTNNFISDELREKMNENGVSLERLKKW